MDSQTTCPFNPQDLIAPVDFVNRWDERITEEEYHADKTAIGSSQLRNAKDSLKKFFGKASGLIEDKETKETKLGRKIHMAILEPDRFRSLYVLEPVFQGKTQKGELTTSLNCKEVKEKRDRWHSDLRPGAVVVTEKELGMITGIAKSLREYPDAMSLIEGARPEVTGYYRDPKTGLKMKIKVDLLTIGNLVLVTDLKSTKNCSQMRFGQSVYSDDLRYDIQLFQYTYGTQVISGKKHAASHLIAVEKEAPYEVAVYFFEEGHLTQAEQDYHATTQKIRHAIDTGLWTQRQKCMEPIWMPSRFEQESVTQDEINEMNAEEIHV